MNTINFPDGLDALGIGEFKPICHFLILSLIQCNSMRVCIFNDNNAEGDPDVYDATDLINIGYAIGKWNDRDINVAIHMVGTQNQYIMLHILKPTK